MPKIIDHDARRAEILDQAFQVFDTDGYGAVSMRSLARALGVSTGTLYHYFDGKDALFAALVRQRFAADLSAFEAGLPEGGVSSEARLGLLAAWVAEHLDQLQATLRLVLDYARQGEPDSPFLLEVLGGYRAQLAQAVGPELASPALSLLLGLLVHRLLDPAHVNEGAHLVALGRMVGS